MSKSPEMRPEFSQLGLLHAHYRARRDALAQRLELLREELDERYLEAAEVRFSFDPGVGSDIVSARLQEEHDEVAFELAYVRLALEELEQERDRGPMGGGEPESRAVA